MECPIKSINSCEFCQYSKEGLCDHPYSVKMKLGEILKLTARR